MSDLREEIENKISGFAIRATSKMPMAVSVPSMVEEIIQLVKEACKAKVESMSIAEDLEDIVLTQDVLSAIDEV